ncbi:MAG: DedA family protein [Bacillota bacterium]
MKEWVMDYLGALGTGGLLLGVIIEAMGIPFPGGLMVILAGFLVNQGRLNLFAVLVATILGFNLGASIAFFIGRCMGEPFLVRFSKYLRVTPVRLEQARQWLKESSAAFIIFGRFVPMVSNLTPYIAGLSGLQFWKFIGYNFLFTLFWASFNLSLGIFFGHSWGYLLSLTRSWLPLAAGGMLVLIFIFLYLRRTRRLT